MMEKKQEVRIKRIVDAYNMIPNLFWSVIFLFPVALFCYNYLVVKYLIIFLLISLVPVFLPRSFFNFFQSPKMAIFYRKAGVGFINKFTQNGTLINKIIRKRYPQYKFLSQKKLSAQQLFQQTYMFEKFHFMLCFFFILINGYACWQALYGWANFIFITNLIYNIYPIFLQHYIRIRILSLQQFKNTAVNK